jgi:hypothetical protein
MTAAQFRQVTGESRADDLDYYCNTEVSYTVRGIHVQMDVLWRYEAPAGTGDTHRAIFRGSKSSIEIRQGAAENYKPELYVVGQVPELAARMRALAARWPGIELEDRGQEALIRIPDRYRVGHEAHFAQVTRRFFEYLKEPSRMPAWERPGMSAKYYVSTEGVGLSRRS